MAVPPRSCQTSRARASRRFIVVSTTQAWRVLYGTPSSGSLEPFLARCWWTPQRGLDVRMPGMSGPELAEVVRQRRPDIKLLLTSGYVGKRRAERPAIRA